MRLIVYISLMLAMSMSGIVSANNLREFNGVLFKNAQVDVTKGWEGIPADWMIQDNGSNYQVVHFSDVVTEAMKSELEQAGATITSYIPNNAFLVKIADGSLGAVQSVTGVDWVGVYQPYVKLDSGIFGLTPSRDGHLIRITIFGGEPFENARAVVKNWSGEVIDEIDGVHYRKMVFRVGSENLINVVKELAFLPEVEWIQRSPEYKLCNDYTYWVCQSGPASGGQTPLYDHGIKGASQVVAVMDTGADADMCFFYDQAQGMVVPNSPPNLNQRKVIAYIGPSSYVGDWDSHGHGTHTAGTIAGNNFATPGGHDTGDGIAVMAKLIIQDYGSSSDVYPPDDEYAAHQACYDYNARVHSNSWGWPGNPGIYHDDCREVDLFIWDHPHYSIVYAAGNEYSSADTIRPPGTSKNVITVGATEHGSTGAEDMADFSSHGPTDDGRRKPDVAMPGDNIISADSDGSPSSHNCSTTSMSGTSMATPGVAGAAALIRDYYQQGFYPLGIANPASILDPSAALVKATMINGAVNMTGAYTADSGSGHGDIPTNGQGWGRVTLDKALYFMGDTRLLYVDDNLAGLSTGGTATYNVAVTSNTESLEITLVWSDYPSTPAATINLVNDLDLTVVGNSQTYKGNVYTTGHSVPGGNYDRLNNVECVQIDNPAPGGYQITIQGYNVPQGPQPFAIVVTGALSFSDGMVSFNKGKYACASTAQLGLSDADISGAGTQAVTVVSTSDLTGETINLAEVGSNSGFFQGTVQFTTAAPGAGQVRVANGDTVTVTYIDADDGMGHQNIPKTDTAVIDCLPPTITGVSVTAVTTNSAKVIWNTNEESDSRVDYGEAVPPDLSASSTSMSMSHEIDLEDLTECTDYVFSVTSTDEAGNTITDNNGGNYYRFTTAILMTLMSYNMDTNPGWTTTGQWAWGQPTGQGGSSGEPDPTSGHTGTNVYGYNLNGDYTSGMPEYALTTPTYDWSTKWGQKLSFWRWLGVESSSYDHARVQVSIDDGSTWTTIWENAASMSDTTWTYCEYDVSDIVGGQSQVKFRWTMGSSDYSVEYCGWNIDDVAVTYASPCNVPVLDYNSSVIDDSAGNNNSELNANESIVMPVYLENMGTNATNVTGVLSTTSSYVTINDGNASFGDIPENAIAGSQAPHYAFTVGAGVPDQTSIPFVLAWTSSETIGSTNFEHTVHAPSLVYDSHVINDATGDNDHTVDPGESVGIDVTLRNSGSFEATGVSATLSVDQTTYITIDDATATFGSIPAGGSAVSQSPAFHIIVSPTTPDPTTATFTMTITAANGYTFSRTFPVLITGITIQFFWNMDTNPGWTTTGQWAWGQPTGAGGDPSSGYTGTNVYGFNLQGAYTNSMPEYTLTAGPLNCSNCENTEISFYRWLGVESSTWDHARFKVSNNGTSWTTIWENGSSSISETTWTQYTYDISAVADHTATLYLQWTMGPTDSSVTYCGWNIDDVQISASGQPANTATPTPILTNTPTRTVTQTATYTPTRTPTPITSVTVTSTPTTPPTWTPTTIASATPTEPPTATFTNTPTPIETPTPTDTPVTTPHTPTEVPTVQPTNTPFGSPTPEPTCKPSGIYCNLNQDTFYPHDTFLFSVEVCNSDQAQIMGEIYIILDVYGSYWFWPAWTQDLDNETWSIPACFCVSEEILNFEWPENAGGAEDINLWVGMLVPGTIELIGEVHVCSFDFAM